MMEFESIVLWTAVGPSWAAERDNWINNCKASQTNQEIATCLIKFEANVLWDVVSPKWHDRRQAWMAECNSLK